LFLIVDTKTLLDDEGGQLAGGWVQGGTKKKN